MAGVFGRKIGGLEDFNYSPAFRSDTRIWTVETLNPYLAHPTQFIPGTWMSTAGIENERIRADMIAYIISLKDVPPE